MASKEHLSILEQGFSFWNDWRNKNTDICPDLSYANLNDRLLRGFNFISCNLKGVKLNRANLRGVYMRNSDLSDSHLNFADLSNVNFISVNLSHAKVGEANMRGANLRNSNLSNADLHDTNLRKAYLKNANLSGAVLSGANLRLSTLIGADLRKADLRYANLIESNLSGANLSEADISNSIMVEANLQSANLTSCRVYGLSAWDVKLDDCIQNDLIITRYDKSRITVDNIEVAQFIHLLKQNEKIRGVIDTITSKVVLILGRFTAKLKPTLDALRAELRNHDYSPIIFDFRPPSSRDLTETVSILAHLSHFIIVDLTEPKSVPQELQSIIPTLSVPVLPILRHPSEEYGMFESLKKYPWVLDTFQYKNKSQLLKSLKTNIILPAEEAIRRLSK
jgi:uncharacterized protein YjbI with pentapeptide repeats